MEAVAAEPLNPFWKTLFTPTNSKSNPSIIPLQFHTPYNSNFPSLFLKSQKPRNKFTKKPPLLVCAADNNSNNSNDDGNDIADSSSNDESKERENKEDGLKNNGDNINGNGNGRPRLNLKWVDLLVDPDPENVVAVGLTGVLAWAGVQVLWQLFVVSIAILLAALKYSFIAALLVFILITLL